MKIVIDLTALADNFTGIERFAVNITEKLLEKDEINQYILVFKENISERMSSFCQRRNVKYIILPRKNKLWFYQITLFRKLRSIKADYYLFLAFPAPFFFNRQGIVNTIHDLGCWDCPESMPLKMAVYFRVLYRRAAKMSRYILTVSEFSKKRIKEMLKVDETKISVIYNGIDDGLKRKDFQGNRRNVLEKYGISSDRPYLLSLATLEPRKNVDLLLKAYNHLVSDGVHMPELVMAGRVGWKVQKTIKESLSSEAGNKIIFTGYIEEMDLPIIYSGARCFVFPSKYEGFGLPPLEALYMKAEVVVSDIEPFRELFSGYVTFFKEGDEADLRHVIEEKCIGRDTIKENLVNNIDEKYNYENEADKLRKLMTLWQ